MQVQSAICPTFSGLQFFEKFALEQGDWREKLSSGNFLRRRPEESGETAIS